MHLYRFFNPSAVGADKCVIIVAATSLEAINAYVARYHNGCGKVDLSWDFHRNNAIIVEISLMKLNDGVVTFCEFCSLNIN